MDPKFKEIIKNVWKKDQARNKSFLVRLAKCRKHISGWKRTNISNAEKKIQQLTSELKTEEDLRNASPRKICRIKDRLWRTEMKKNIGERKKR